MNIYLWIGIGSVHGRTGDILAYLFTWTNTFVLKPSGIAVLTLTFSQYFLSGVMDGKQILKTSIDVAHSPVHLDCGPPEELVKMLAIFAICMFILSVVC
jgi:hypothetical protein